VAEGYGWSHIKCGFPAKVDHEIDENWGLDGDFEVEIVSGTAD